MSKRIAYKAAESNSRQPRQVINGRAKSPLGVLALIVNPTLHDNSAFSISTASSHHLTFFDLDPTASRISSRKRRRKEGFGGRESIDEFDVENQDITTLRGASGRKDEIGNGISASRPSNFRPSASEFTLLYFYESSSICKNSGRFTPILASFMSSIQNSYENGDNSCMVPCQLICVPNYDDESERYFRQGQCSEPNILTHLSSEAYFWHLGVDHINRLAIIRMLSVSAVPTLIVINNKTGLILTSWGMEAIECWSQHNDRSNGKSNHELLENWRKGNSGVSCCSKVAGVCVIL